MSKSSTAVQVKVLWGDTAIYVTELSPPRSFSVGEDDCDFSVPAQALGARRLELVGVQGESLALLGQDGQSHAVAAGSDAFEVSIARGELTFELRVGPPEASVARALGDGELRGTAAYFGASLCSVGALFAAMAFMVPPSGLTDGEGIHPDQLIAMQAYLEASAERELEEQKKDATQSSGESGESGAQAEGREGEMGKPESPARKARFQLKGPPDNPKPELSRLEEARTFGLIGLLSGGAGDLNAPSAPWGRDAALGSDEASLLGNLWGDDIGEAAGANGLGLYDDGQGGGGRYQGIGLDRVGTIGSTLGDCKVGESCAGFSRGPGSGGHRVKSPVLRADGSVTMSGRLPPEVVQRVVRQNFGRFRHCYERGLGRNPNLQGRVAVRFLISSNGTVASAANGGSSLPDAEVASCVVSAFYGISFPKPEQGSVTVSYPIAFSPQ